MSKIGMKSMVNLLEISGKSVVNLWKKSAGNPQEIRGKSVKNQYDTCEIGENLVGNLWKISRESAENLSKINGKSVGNQW